MQLKWPEKPYSTMLTLVSMFITITLLLFAPFAKPWPKVFEATLYLLCFLLLASYQPVRSLFAAIPQAQRRGILCLGIILLVTQLKDRPQETFPFIPWNMYHGRFTEPPQYLEYIGVCPDGREVKIPVGQVFASQHRTVLWHLHSLSNQIEAETSESIRQKHIDRFRSLLVAVVARFNEQHPGTDVIRVQVIQCSMPRPTPGLFLEVTRRMLREYFIS